MPSLTSRQAEVLGIIKTFRKEKSYSPSYRDLAALLGVSSLNAVKCHLRALEKKGMVTRDGRKARTLMVA